MGDGGGNPEKRRLRWKGPRAWSVLTLLAVSAAALGVASYVRREVDRNEAARLTRTAEDLGQMTGQLISRLEGTVAPIYAVAEVTRAFPPAVSQAAQAPLGRGTLAAVVVFDRDGTAVASAGSPRLPRDFDQAQRQLVLATADKGGLSWIGETGGGLAQRFAIAYARPGSTSGLVVYGEMSVAALPSLLPAGFMTAGDQLTDMQMAIYSNADQTGSPLFSTSSGPLPQPRQSALVPAGTESWSLVVSPGAPLSSRLERSTPRIVLVCGLLAALLLAGVVEATSRRRRRAAFVREERFSLLVQQSSDVVTVIDPEGVVSYLSPSAGRVLGYQPADLAGATISDLIHPDDRHGFRAALDGALTGPGKPLFAAVRLRHHDGRWLRLEVAGRNLLHEPVIGGLVLNWLDVSEREEAREARARLASVLEATPDVVLTADAEGSVVFVNSAARRLLGLGADDLDGRRLLTFFPEHSVATLAHAIDAVRRDGTWSGELAIATPTGEMPVLGVLVEHKDEREGTSFVSFIARDIRDRKALEHQLAHQAFHDDLTGLPNRALFNDRLSQAIERSRRTLDTAAVLLIDLDDFKTVNDSLGHPAGDALLTLAAARIRACLRASDTLARLGGDEFAVVLEPATGDIPHAVAERIVTAFSLPFSVSGRELITTASVGVAPVGLLCAQSTDEALQAADVALYAAKSKGKAAWSLFEPTMLAAASERLELQVDLRRAVERDELVLHYQPIVDVAAGNVVGVEALVRWQHPRLGLLAPDRFINLAEETGLIVELGRWVLRRACAQLAEWHQHHPALAGLHLSVNVSGRQLEDSAFPLDVEAALADTGVNPELLVLEITENVLIQYAPAADLLRQLKALGVRLAIDDFGTGYSSFSSLQHLPIDVLKIDKSFIDGMGTGSREPTLVGAILRMGQAMGLEVVAEGVEEAEQAASLSALNCPMAQGFFYARPTPPEPPERILRLMTEQLGTPLPAGDATEVASL